MLLNATKQKATIQSGSLDRTEAMTTFIKQQKIIKELSKGVQSMKAFIYPSLL